MTQVQLPYFDYLLAELAKGNPSISKSFGRHVHWGYWEQPAAASCDDEDYAQAAERLTAEICGLAAIEEGMRLLDVGCGFGGTVAFLNERFAALDLCGVNIDDRQLERARQIVTARAGNKVEFQRADACELPFPDESVDIVLAVECIFHFPSREAFFREAARVLKPGGVLVLSDFIPAAVFAPICRIPTPRWIQKYSALGNCDVRYSLSSYRELAARTGLRIGLERNVTAQTLPTYRYIQNLLARNFVSGWLDGMFARLLGLNRLLGVTGLLSYYLLSFRKPG